MCLLVVWFSPVVVAVERLRLSRDGELNHGRVSGARCNALKHKRPAREQRICKVWKVGQKVRRYTFEHGQCCHSWRVRAQGVIEH
jgi:hypothetical protein